MAAIAPPCRIVEFGVAHTGQWNMACDEWLLESVLDGGPATIRVYAWSRPTVSLGYFQQPEDVASNPRLAGIDHVRRLSGGGAIVHEHEWTYSCVVPPGDTANIPGDRLYARIHQALIDEIKATTSHDIPQLRLRGQTPSDTQSPALCFSRTAADDVVHDGHKVIGSAQRRRRGGILQHGSLLLKRSSHAPDFPGLFDLIPSLALPGNFSELMARAIASTLQWTATVTPLSDSEKNGIEQLVAQQSMRSPRTAR
jgi:lipoate-protein ligase A